MKAPKRLKKVEIAMAPILEEHARRESIRAQTHGVCALLGLDADEHVPRMLSLGPNGMLSILTDEQLLTLIRLLKEKVASAKAEAKP